MLRRGFQVLRRYCSDAETRLSSCLGTALVAMISLASRVWTLLSDDLSSVIFGQSTKLPSKFLIFLTGTDFEILWTLVEFILLMIGLTII